MSILSIDHPGGMFRHQCSRCGYEDDLRIDPAAGHVRVAGHVGRRSLIVRDCPHCAAHGVHDDGSPLTSTDCYRLDVPAWEAGEAPHPGSLVGTELPGPPGSGIVNVVSEHTEGYHLHPDRVRLAKLLRALQRHPHLAPHAPPLPEDLPALPGHPYARWDGQWQPGDPSASAAVGTVKPAPPGRAGR